MLNSKQIADAVEFLVKLAETGYGERRHVAEEVLGKLGMPLPTREDTRPVLPGAISLRLVEFGELRVQVSRDAYAAAKAAENTGNYLDRYASTIDTQVTVYEPDGTSYDPWGLR